MRSKKKIYFLLFLTIIAFGFINLKPKADSGWDSSYDSGSSWDSGSSYDSSSYSYYGSSNNMTGGDAIIILIIVIVFIIWAMKSGNNKTNTSALNNSLVELDDEIISKYKIDKESFKKMVYDKYVLIQKDWMNFNYQGLEKNLTNELYNTYMMQLDVLKLKNQKNIMKDFELIDVKIINIKEENNLLNIETYLNVEMYDYVIDKDEKVIRGSNTHKINIEYLITFVKKSDNKDNIMKCPNCGASVDIVTSAKCEYCGSIIVVDARDFVMSKKTCIGQRDK